MSASTIDVILLAGDRGPDDPLARLAGTAGKALVPVAGTAMLTRVLRTLGQWPRLGRVVLVAPDAAPYDDAIGQGGLPGARLTRIAPAGSLNQSVGAALAACDGARPVLVATADHPLIETAWLDEMLAGESGADLQIGLADWSAVMARFPGSRRTRYRFGDRSICGTNLFLFRTHRADAVINTWRQVEQDRKRPWRIVGLLGWTNLARYLAGRLRLVDAFDALSKKLDVTIRPVILQDPLSAVDVDSEADLALVEQVMAQRGRSC